jgi:hypothetical protein
LISLSKATSLHYRAVLISAFGAFINACATSADYEGATRPQLSIQPHQEIVSLLPRETAITALQALSQDAALFGLNCEVVQYGVRGERDNVAGDRGPDIRFDRLTIHYDYVWRYKDVETERKRMTQHSPLGFWIETAFADKTKREAVAVHVTWPLYWNSRSEAGCIIAAQEITGESRFTIDSEKMQKAVDALTALGAKMGSR